MGHGGVGALKKKLWGPERQRFLNFREFWQSFQRTQEALPCRRYDLEFGTPECPSPVAPTLLRPPHRSPSRRLPRGGSGAGCGPPACSPLSGQPESCEVGRRAPLHLVVPPRGNGPWTNLRRDFLHARGSNHGN